MKKYSLLIIFLGLAVFAGGIIGFVKAGSIASLIMGTVFSLVLFISGFFVSRNNLFAFYVATFTTLSLHVFFLMRFLKSYKLMPAGFMVLLTTAIGAPLISFLTKYVKESSVDAN